MAPRILKDFRIRYANRKTIETLRSLEHLLPVTADEPVGACIDVFHENPARQRKLPADPKNLPHHAVMGAGDEFLDPRSRPSATSPGRSARSMKSPPPPPGRGAGRGDPGNRQQRPGSRV